MAPAHFQVAHLAPFAEDASVDVNLDGVQALTGFGYGDSTGYFELTPGEHLVEIMLAGTSTVAISATMDVKSGKHYTDIAIGDGVNQDLALIALEDDLTPPAAGTFKVCVGHVAPFESGAATADVRLKGSLPEFLRPTVKRGKEPIQEPQVAVSWRVALLGFGLEGINNDTGHTTCLAATLLG